MSPTLRGALLSLAAFGLYATHDVVVKTLGAHYTSFQIIFFSGLLSFPLVSILLMSDRTDGNLVPRHPWWSLLRSVTGVATGAMGFYAFSVLPMAQCYAILFAMPLLITLLSIPMLGEKVGMRRGLAVMVGLAGRDDRAAAGVGAAVAGPSGGAGGGVHGRADFGDRAQDRQGRTLDRADDVSDADFGGGDGAGAALCLSCRCRWNIWR